MNIQADIPHMTPEEMKAAKSYLLDLRNHGDISTREWLDRDNEIDGFADAVIAAYAIRARGYSAARLLKIASSMMGGGYEQDLVDAVRALIDTTDPEDAPNAVDCVHKALSDVSVKVWNYEY